MENIKNLAKKIKNSNFSLMAGHFRHALHDFRGAHYVIFKKMVATLATISLLFSTMPLITWAKSGSLPINNINYFIPDEAVKTQDIQVMNVVADDETVTIPDSVNYWPDGYETYTYYNCPVTSLYYNNNISTVFANCSSVKTINIQSTKITNIPLSIFDNCTNLEAINIDSGNPNYASEDGVLYNKDETELLFCPPAKTGNVTIPSTVTSIGASAFSGCKKLTSITFPCRNEIDPSSINLPSNVKTIAYTDPHDINQWSVSSSLDYNYEGRCRCKHTGENFKVSLNESTHKYDGTEWAPEVEVEIKKESNTTQTLTKGSDYTVSFPDDMKSAGTKDIVVNFKKDGYGGSVTLTGTIEKATPQSSDFDFTPPTNLIYNGESKTATITTKIGITGMGNIVGLYYSSDGGLSWTNTAPKNAGTYKVKVNVDDGVNYEDIYDLTNDTWTFTITKATPTYNNTPDPAEATYGNTLETIKSYLTEIGTPLGVDGTTVLPGAWSWDALETTLVGDVGTNNFDATFTPTDTTNYNTITQSLSVNVVAKPLASDSSDIKVTLNDSTGNEVVDSTFKYDGTKKVPTVTVKDGETTLIEDTHYTKQYLKIKDSSGNDISNPGQITDPTDAGTYQVKISGKENYNGTVTKEFIINKKILTAAITASNKTYDGNQNTNVTATVDTGIVGETLTIANLTGTFESKDFGTEKTVTVDSSAVTVTGNENGTKPENYTITYPLIATANIIKKPITVTADDKNKIYGKEDPTFTYTISEETPLVSGDSLTGSLDRVDGENVEEYVIDRGTLDNSNYEITFTNGKFTITKATPTYNTPAPAEATYGDTLKTIESYLTKIGTPLGFDGTSELPGEWSWNNAETTLVGDVGTNYFDATFTPEDITNYNTITQSLPVNVVAKPLASDSSDVKVTLNDSTGTEVVDSTFTYDGTKKVPTVTVKDGETTLTEGTDYDIIYPDDMTNVGEKEITIKYKGNYSGEKIVKVTIEVDKSEWGNEIDSSGVKNYVSSDGITSVEISKENADNNGVIWLKEESYGTSAWYGINNLNGTFKEGSRFWTRWLNKNSDGEEWQKYYDNLDETHKNNVEGENLWIFLVGVEDPDGNEYTNFSSEIPFYIQLGEDWDKNDINAVFISNGNDEIVDVTYLENMNFPGGNATFAKLSLKHFSPYAVYDKLNDEERAALNKLSNKSNSTGETYAEIYMDFSLILVSAAVMIFIAFKRKKFIY